MHVDVTRRWAGMAKPEIVARTNPPNPTLIRCPDCGLVGAIDQEQFEGKVSMVCKCGWHETWDLRKVTHG